MVDAVVRQVLDAERITVTPAPPASPATSAPPTAESQDAQNEA
jgi:hypothetical protein